MRFDPNFSDATELVSPRLVAKLDALRAELVDLAFVLECRGRVDAADIALEISERLSAWQHEFAATTLPSTATSATEKAVS